MESKYWEKVFLQSISILISEIHDYAQMSAKCKFIAKALLKPCKT